MRSPLLPLICALSLVACGPSSTHTSNSPPDTAEADAADAAEATDSGDATEVADTRDDATSMDTATSTDTSDADAPADASDTHTMTDVSDANTTTDTMVADVSDTDAALGAPGDPCVSADECRVGRCVHLLRDQGFCADAELPISEFEVSWAPPADQQDYLTHLGPVGTVYDPIDPSEIAGFPRAWAFDVLDEGTPRRRVMVSFTQNPDEPTADQVISYAMSDGLGWEFPAEGLRFDTVSPTQMARLEDGRLLDVGFVPASGSSDGIVVHAAHSDDGERWEAFEAPVTFDEPISPAGRTHLGLLVSTDGSVMVPHYVQLQGDLSHSVVLLRSEDGGQTWSQRGIVGRQTGHIVYNETSVARVVDGSLLAIMRSHEHIPAVPNPLVRLRQLEVSRSLDDGRTWSDPEPLMVAFDGVEGPRLGVDPHLLLLPNGILALSGGRLDNWIAFSFDGRGTRWEAAEITYVNRPAPPGEERHGSSGYSGMAYLQSNRLLLTGDNCAPTWGCPERDTGHTVDNQYRVWRRQIDAITPGAGRIDLTRGVAAGSITVASNFDYTSTSRPRALATGAFDSSVEVWSTAARAGSEEGILRLRLDREHWLHRVGLAIAIGREAEAQVRVSLDGVRWSEPVVSTGTRTHYAMEYFELPTAVRTRYVEVAVRNHACPAELGAGCAMLNEVELYSDIDSFENTPRGTSPRGYDETAQAYVSVAPEHDSTYALRIHDRSETIHARAIQWEAPSTAKVLEFRVYPQSLPGAMLFDLLSDDPETAAYHLAIYSDGGLGRWDARDTSWSRIAPAGTVPTGAWSTVRIEADGEQALISVNDALVATVLPSTTGFIALGGYGFYSSGTAPTGDDFYIDDVRFADR